MHEISSNTLYVSPIGSMYKVIDAFKEAGFNVFDMSVTCLVEQCDIFIDKDDYIDRVKKFKAYCDSINMKSNQCHSFLKNCNKSFSKEENDYLWEMALRSIDIAGIMDSKIIVFHPFSTYSLKENIKMFKTLNIKAKENNLKIAIENMPGGYFSYPESINELLDSLNDENIGLCLDTGHAHMPKEHPTTAIEIIEKCSKYIICLHIDDNNGIYDDHFLPGDGNIDFKAIAKALKDINYQGDYTFEVDGFIYPKKIEDKPKCLYDIMRVGKELFLK